ncbi:SIR2 family NAD-dependent protein deacylase [Caballeronia zhejiangensis]|uniref:SIR2 family NAD-dependent protein deacylase n=1 Tax=Caballeronia zhejiangensis TaxID=871203 RepID=UPI001EF64DA5|nr:Sir2 family NAD-dependent protein deacetylase [Caballeronia zhejiangensis]MCG7400495.1 Sir2 family transcriptional regulator [Caballeronia zhejiangensis]
MDTTENVDKAFSWIKDADGLLITAGAGMGVDSGLPDFRGQEGFWRAYPALRHEGFNFEQMATAERFEKDPTLAWGFYGHRLRLYRETEPHEGFSILRKWAAQMARGAFVFTSNVDGQFQKAGFAPGRIHECHGTIHQLQCVAACRQRTWPADEFQPAVDANTARIVGRMPHCPDCGRLARPNILMFWDAFWVENDANAQEARLRAWYASVQRPVVVELGAGKALPTVRAFSQRHARHRLIRINVRESATNPQDGVGFAGGALDSLRQLDTRLIEAGWSD